LVVGGKGAESSKVKAERIETEKIRRLARGSLTADKKMGDWV